jgi:hypothetical protein
LWSWFASFLFFPAAFFAIAEGLREAGKELNNIWFIEAAKWYKWGIVGSLIGIGVFLCIAGFICEVKGAWHLHEISEEMNSSEIERKEE